MLFAMKEGEEECDKRDGEGGEHAAPGRPGGTEDALSVRKAKARTKG